MAGLAFWDEVQDVAAGAMAWCSAMGGHIEKSDMVGKLSRLAASGRHAQNCERDLQRSIKRFGYSIGARIEEAPVRLWNPSTSEVYETMLPVASLN